MRRPILRALTLILTAVCFSHRLLKHLDFGDPFKGKREEGLISGQFNLCGKIALTAY